MIRERVSTIGVCRPLEPPSDLSALQMPEDEVGVIKEGQAMRYLNGQKLWDKKFHRAAHSVEKHRRKNLKDAKERDGKKLARLWEDRLRHHHHHHHNNQSQGSGNETDEGWETDGGGGGGQEKGLMDQSWSWEWALHGEAPPPSAIVSRRDFVSHIPIIPPRTDYFVEVYTTLSTQNHLRPLLLLIPSTISPLEESLIPRAKPEI